MPKRKSKTGSELFIVDNSDEDWKVLQYLRDWCQISKGLDVATGCFEIGSLLALDGEWQKVDQIRVLMGDEVSLRTKQAFVEGVKRVHKRLDDSLEFEKERNDFLVGVPAVVDAIRSGKIACRVYRKNKFHAKAYITHARMDVVGSAALAGSSNLTYPGLTENVELNVQITGGPVTVLQEWFNQHWADGEDVTPDVLRTIERHVHEYSPFQVYIKALDELLKGHELTGTDWENAGPENGGSRVFPILDEYQRQGYHALLGVARQYGGAFLCDGVGLGKTFVGLMLIERLIAYEHSNVVLLAPKGTREGVWDPALRRYLGHLHGAFRNLEVFNHTDLNRGGEYPAILAQVKERADAVVIDEAHHFRNPGAKGVVSWDTDEAAATGRIPGVRRARPSRYRILHDLLEGPNGVKQVYLLTATPVNNTLHDFRHMLELFCRSEDRFGSSLGIHSLRGHFNTMDQELWRLTLKRESGDAVPETDMAEAQEILLSDALFQALVVQRSRAYVKQSQLQEGSPLTSFPEREAPKVAAYSIKATYGHLLDMVDEAFSRENPLFSLAVYYPLAYYRGPDASIDPFTKNRQKQVVGLIRTQFLKRFESSVRAFERSCERLMVKLLVFVTLHSESATEKRRLDRWMRQHDEVLKHVQEHVHELWGGEDDDEADDDLVSEEMREGADLLSREDYRVEEMLAETFLDLDQIVVFLDELRKLKPGRRDKIRTLVNLLKNDPILSKHKVLIFTEFADTARFIRERLDQERIQGVAQVDSSTGRDRGQAIRRFTPYYNDSSSGELESEGLSETRVLVSTDILSEGLNLQDCTRLINYDLHWNPVRLMQRIGRVDRRMNPDVEAQLVGDHPEEEPLRGKVVYWNFLPPDELNALLHLYNTVAHKTLVISKTFGIEGRKLLTPEDDYEALREFNHQYEGTTSTQETMRLELQKLKKEHPALAAELEDLPGRVFSGKEHPSQDARAVFFCYAIPAPEAGTTQPEDGGEARWTMEAGTTHWYLFDLASGEIIDDIRAMWESIRCEPQTPRRCEIERSTLSEIRAKIEKHIKNTYLRRVQAPVGVKPTLKAWMELN